MAIEFNDNIHVKINRPTDFRFGPFTDINQANATIPIAQRYHGLIFGVYTTPLSIATSDIKFYYYWDGLSNSDIKELGGKPPVDGSYASQAAMIAAQTTQTAQYIYYDGTSYWEYLGTTNGNITDYREINNQISPGFGLSIDGSNNIRLGNSNSNNNYTELDFSSASITGYTYNQFFSFARELNKYLGYYEFYNDKSLSTDYWYIKHDFYTIVNSFITPTDTTSVTFNLRNGTNSAINGGTFANAELTLSRNSLDPLKQGIISINLFTDFNAGSLAPRGITITDSIYKRGAFYDGDYETNFVARSLVTKQYVDGAISSIGSKWTDVGSDIYRDSAVAIGRSTIPTNATFAVQSKTATTTHKFFQVLNNLGSELFSIRQDGLGQYIGDGGGGFSFGNISPSSNLLRHRSSLNGNAGIQFLIEDSLGVSNFQVDNIGRTVIRNDVTLSTRVRIGGAPFVASGGTGLSIKQTNSGVDGLQIYDQSDVLRVRWRTGLGLEILNTSGNRTISLSNNLTLDEGTNQVFGTATGTKIGTTTSQKIGFWNATPIVQPSGDILTALQNLGLVASPTISVSPDTNKVSYNVADSKNSTERNQARVNIGSTSATPQIITTAGAINDLVVTSNSLVFTGASVVLSGIVAGLDGEEIAILNTSGTNLELLSESALSSANNRFSSGVIVPNFSIVRIKYRTTTARWVLENVGVNDGRYVRKDVIDTKANTLILRSAITGIGYSNLIIQDFGGADRINLREAAISSTNASFEWTGQQMFFRTTVNATASILFLKNFSGSNIYDFRTDKLIIPTIPIDHSRSTTSIQSVRRDELYLNYSQTVATAGTINDLAINADCKLLILTGATDLTGVVPVDNTRLLRIEARGGNRIIRDQNVGSIAANRFDLGADLTINDGEVYQFIYTNSRWRRVF